MTSRGRYSIMTARRVTGKNSHDQTFNLSLLHLVDTDAVGHSNNRTTDSYLGAVKQVDSQLQTILSMIDNSPALNVQATVVLVAVHSETSRAHSDVTSPLN